MTDDLDLAIGLFNALCLSAVFWFIVFKVFG